MLILRATAALVSKQRLVGSSFPQRPSGITLIDVGDDVVVQKDSTVIILEVYESHMHYLHRLRGIEEGFVSRRYYFSYLLCLPTYLAKGR